MHILPDITSLEVQDASPAELRDLLRKIDENQKELAQKKDAEKAEGSSEPHNTKGEQADLDESRQSEFTPEIKVEKDLDCTTEGLTGHEFEQKTALYVENEKQELSSDLKPAERFDPGPSTYFEACVACKERGQKCVPHRYIFNLVSSPN